MLMHSGPYYRDATGTVQKSRKLSLDRGSGGSPLEARAFSQSELPRKPPIDTHGRYTCIQYMHGGKKERKKKKKKGGKKKKVGKSEGLKKSEKRHPCY